MVQADSEALLVLCQLMRLRDAPAKQHLQRVLSNLCVHSETRAQLFRILMAMLRPDSQAQERSEPPDLSQEAPAGPASLDDALQVGLALSLTHKCGLAQVRVPAGALTALSCVLHHIHTFIWGCMRWADICPGEVQECCLELQVNGTLSGSI